MIATTIAQSQRLLKARISRATADMMWVPVITHKGVVDALYVGHATPNGLPAWSLSALWDFFHNMDKTYEFPTDLSSDELIENLVNIIISRTEYNGLRKSI